VLGEHVGGAAIANVRDDASDEAELAIGVNPVAASQLAEPDFVAWFTELIEHLLWSHSGAHAAWSALVEIGGALRFGTGW
jgi:hypothetical protein